MTDLLGDEQARWVFRRSATLARAACEPIGPFILPDGRFFPDRFDGTPAAVGKLFARMQKHVGLDAVDVELVVVDPEDASLATSCSSGGCSPSAKVATLSGERVTITPEGGYVAKVAVTEVRHPTVLTSALAHALGAVFLAEADVARRLAPAERAPAADLAAILLGLGVLVANGAGVEVKGCGGVKVHQTTALPLSQAVLALAITSVRHRVGAASFVRQLDPPARAAFGEARALAEGNADVVRRVGDAPDAVERGDFVLKSGSGWLDRALTRLRGGRGGDPVDELERELARIARS